MAARRPSGRPAAADNPFSRLGIDKSAVEVLFHSGDSDAILTAVKGMKRVLTRALHPDTGLPTEGAADYLDQAVQAADKIESLSSEDILILARAFSRARDRRGSRVEKKYTDEFFDENTLHDGVLLGQIVDMIAASGESVPSVRNKMLLVRPLDFDKSKPADAKGVYDWYPPSKSRVGLFEIDGGGMTKWTELSQTSHTGVMRKELRKYNVSKEADTFRRSLEDSIWERIGGAIDRGLTRDAPKFLVAQKNGRMLAYLGKRGELVTSTECIDAELGMVDGIYVMDMSRGRAGGIPAMHDSYYAFKSDYTEGVDEGILVAGFGDGDFVSLQKEQIFGSDRSWTAHQALPSSTGGGSTPYAYSVPDFMRKYLQRSYTPQIPDMDKGSVVVGTNKDGEVLLLGGLLHVADGSAGQ